ncbi:hypothetical protein SUGI_0522170 [Cryptomeria japonica]|nr:hypothetical protein SUGI_0522170 [Cryptomeria japonica]
MWPLMRAVQRVWGKQNVKCREVLCENGFTVILTARNEERGRAALHSLRSQGFQHNLEFFPFDVTSDESACRLAEWIKHSYGKLDILINNAALGGTKIDMEYLKAHQLSRLQALKLKDDVVKEQLFRIETLTEEFIDSFINKYLQDVKNSDYPNINSKWPEKYATYKVSKIALNTYSRLLAQKLFSADEKKIIYVNCVHPGHIKIDMTFNERGESPTKRAANIVKVALLPHSQHPTGQMFMEGETGNFITTWVPSSTQ